MSICYNVRGNIVLEKETIKEVETKFSEIIKKYDNDCKFKIVEEHDLLSFKLYARHFIIGEIFDYLQDNIDKLYRGEIWFNCYDEDSFGDDGFPFIIYIEVNNGKVEMQSLNRKLPYDWDMHFGGEGY